MTDMRVRDVESGATLEGTPELVAGMGPALVQEWLLEADGTAYRAIVVWSDVEVPVGIVRRGESPKARLGAYAYVMCNVGGGGSTGWGDNVGRWSVDGGGAWYPFARGGFLADHYVAEKFRLNRVDAFHVTRLLRAALSREEA